MFKFTNKISKYFYSNTTKIKILIKTIFIILFMRIKFEKKNKKKLLMQVVLEPRIGERQEN